MTRYVDLSLPLRNYQGRPSVLHYRDHRTTATERGAEYGFDPATLPLPGIHMAHETYTVGAHQGGTHVDAPWHYGPTTGGRPARTVDELPLDWFRAPGVVLDLSDAAAGSTIRVDAVRVAADGIDGGIPPGTIVLVRTGADRYWGSPEYELRSPGLSREAVLWLLDRGVRVIGIDAFSLDPPVAPMVQALREGDAAAYFPAHLVGREREFCIIERLANLERLPRSGFEVTAFPVLVERGSGGWCRAVAALPGGP